MVRPWRDANVTRALRATDVGRVVVAFCSAKIAEKRPTGRRIHDDMKWASTLAILSLLVACSGTLKYQVGGTQLSPGADAKICADVNHSQGKTDLEIKATNLAPPDRLMPDGKTYVVWTRKDEQAQWSRVGALELEDDGRTGKGKFTTPMTAFDMIVSVEKDPSAAAPSGKTVFEKRVQK